MESELSFFQEFTLEQWRKSAQIPNHLLIYSKIKFYKFIPFILFFILSIHLFTTHSSVWS